MAVSTRPVSGIHHITALSKDAQKTADFYSGVLGLRLVKKTVNFDAPNVYHLYFGDETGRPGTIITFFPFPDAARGMKGSGEIHAVAFSVNPESILFWKKRLAVFESTSRFGEEVIFIEDPDGMRIELIARANTGHPTWWNGSPIDAANGVTGFHGVTMVESSTSMTTQFLTGVMGFTAAGKESQRDRFIVGTGEETAFIDIIEDAKGAEGWQGAGSVHHIAWRVTDDEHQREWRERLVSSLIPVTPVQDRNYFRSIYFREPGGVLFEIATDVPGFLVDEDIKTLGSALKLPQWIEPRRESLERVLPSVKNIFQSVAQ